MPLVLLHLTTSDGWALIGVPAVVGVAAGVLVVLAALQWGWRLGCLAAAAGLVLLVAGITGDTIVHANSHDHELPMMIMMHPRSGPLVGEAEIAQESQNRWHLVAAAGEGMLVAGLAGAGLMLYLRLRRYERWAAAATQTGTLAPERDDYADDIRGGHADGPKSQGRVT